MGTISLVIPQIGQPDTTEDVKVQNAFTTIQTVINGNIDPTNLSPTGGILSLAERVVTTSSAATSGQWIKAAGTPPYTITLPASTLNAIVAVSVATASVSGTAPVTITAASGVISGPGFSSASMLLGANTAFVVLMCDGTNWSVLAGGQDSGWLDLPLSAGLSVSGNCQGRLKGDQVVFRGGILNVSAGNLPSGSFLTTSIPAAIKPTGSVVIQTVVYATSPYPLVTQFTGGTNHYQLVAGTFVQGDTIFLHDKTYMLT